MKPGEFGVKLPAAEKQAVSREDRLRTVEGNLNSILRVMSSGPNLYDPESGVELTHRCQCSEKDGVLADVLKELGIDINSDKFDLYLTPPYDVSQYDNELVHTRIFIARSSGSATGRLVVIPFIEKMSDPSEEITHKVPSLSLEPGINARVGLVIDVVSDSGELYDSESMSAVLLKGDGTSLILPENGYDIEADVSEQVVLDMVVGEISKAAKMSRKSLIFRDIARIADQTRTYSSRGGR